MRNVIAGIILSGDELDRHGTLSDNYVGMVFNLDTPEKIEAFIRVNAEDSAEEDKKLIVESVMADRFDVFDNYGEARLWLHRQLTELDDGEFQCHLEMLM